MSSFIDEVVIWMVLLAGMLKSFANKAYDFCRDFAALPWKQQYTPIVLQMEDEGKGVDDSTAIFTEDEVRSIIMRGSGPNIC